MTNTLTNTERRVLNCKSSHCLPLVKTANTGELTRGAKHQKVQQTDLGSDAEIVLTRSVQEQTHIFFSTPTIGQSSSQELATIHSRWLLTAKQLRDLPYMRVHF